MGITSLIEIDHDFIHRIEEHPHIFVKELLRACLKGPADGPKEITAARFIVRFHRHQTGLDTKWEKFKQNLGK